MSAWPAVGIIAGGGGRRAGGRDKGWIERGGRPQIEWLLSRIGTPAGLLVSANRNLDRYRRLGATVIADPPGLAGDGPLVGVHALLSTVTVPWLLTLPVDIAMVPDQLLPRFAAAAASTRDCVVAHDADGMQPLVALYPRTSATALASALAAGERSPARWLAGQGAKVLRFPGMRFGNLNRSEDFQQA